jgi:cell division protein FtsI/penicillin-binding protein 2
MVSETLSRRSTALWLFVAGFVGLLLILKLTESSSPTSASATTPPQEPRRASWLRRLALAPIRVDEDSLPDKEPETPAPRWAKHLDLEKTHVRSKRLAQRLTDGTTLWMTVDPRLQRAARRMFQKYEVPYAAAVMIEVRTGKILLMEGHSEADPGLKAAGLCLNAWAPAASVFKVVTAAALLSENRARPFTKVCYHGGFHGLEAHHLIDDEEKDDRCDTLASGLAKSINPIFGKLAMRHLGRKTLLKYANAFGFNQKLDFIRPVGVSPAAIPKSSFERAKVAAGFWHTNLSPLHAAMMAQAIANRGRMVRPRLVDTAQAADGRKLELPSKWSREVVTEYGAKLVGRMMVMTSTVGTARDDFYDRRGRAYVPWGKVAGKTGSLSRTDPYVAYSWFVGFAPHEKPEVAFAVLLGNPKKWRIKAATAARLLLRAYGRLRPYDLPAIPKSDPDGREGADDDEAARTPQAATEGAQ